MPDYAVCVAFTIKPDRRDDFLARVRRQARDSLTEPGCRVFDVWTDLARPNEVFLYEIYVGEEGFQAHLETPHFLGFDRAVRDWVEAKRALAWSRKEIVDG
jgi:(4S)-4-hydroxy-5-phosphonooxypentane-2,3-dione isomerase